MSRWDCAIDLLRIPLERRFTYHPQENLFFVNFEGHVVRNHEDVERIRRIVETMLAPLGRKVYVIVNYDNFDIFPDVIDEYSAMVRDLVDRFYSGVTRYTTSGFLRTKLGDALKQRAVAPHIYESAEEASAHLRELGARTQVEYSEQEHAHEQVHEAAHSSPNSRDRESATAAQDRPPTADGMLSPRVPSTPSRTSPNGRDRLVRLQAERLKSDDGYQVIDPRTVAATFQEFAQTAQVDPARLIKEQFRLWADMALLWQQTAGRASVQYARRAGYFAKSARQTLQERALGRKLLLRLHEAILSSDVALSSSVGATPSRASIRTRTTN